MSCIVPRAFILFTDAKDKRFVCYLKSKVHKERQILHVSELKLLIYIEKVHVSPFSLFAFYGSDNLVPSIRDFSCTLHKLQELRRLFVNATRSIQGNCYPYHCKASVEQTHQTEPLKAQCFDFADGLKHSELSHFAL